MLVRIQLCLQLISSPPVVPRLPPLSSAPLSSGQHGLGANPAVHTYTPPGKEFSQYEVPITLLFAGHTVLNNLLAA
jgi:hypothetical protein